MVAHSKVVPKGELIQGSLCEGMEVREVDQGKQILGSKTGEAKPGKQNMLRQLGVTQKSY